MTQKVAEDTMLRKTNTPTRVMYIRMYSQSSRSAPSGQTVSFVPGFSARSGTGGDTAISSVV